jgi:pimeloyl-ACP methyl ester carboxylesterase
MVDAGGYRVHLYCTGEGSPTVIVTGAGFSFDWSLVQPEVAKFARICTYDRSGTAWSEPGPRSTCSQRSDELHRVLKTARIPAPYILAGHSVGAIVARLYAKSNPDEVAGVVFVDHAFGPQARPQMTVSITPAPGSTSPPILISQPTINLNVQEDGDFAKLPPHVQELHRWAAALPEPAQNVGTSAGCLSEEPQASLGNVPLIVVSQAIDDPAYTSLQTKLLLLSKNSRQIVARDSGHFVTIDRPDVVIDAIHRVVDAARSHEKLH